MKQKVLRGEHEVGNVCRYSMVIKVVGEYFSAPPAASFTMNGSVYKNQSIRNSLERLQFIYWLQSSTLRSYRYLPFKQFPERYRRERRNKKGSRERFFKSNLSDKSNHLSWSLRSFDLSWRERETFCLTVNTNSFLLSYK